MSGLELIPLGVGNAFSARHYSTCLALRAEGRWLLVDCPHPIRKMMREGSANGGLELDLDRVEAVALTHLHADHASGLEGYGFYAHFVLRCRARIAAHPAVTARLWGSHLAGGMEALRSFSGGPRLAQRDDYFDVLALDETGPVRVGPFEIACRRTHHPIPTTALRIRAADRTLAYSADTDFDPALIAWLAPADLVIHETGPGIHTPLDRLGELPAALRSRMRLVHYPDEFDLSASPIEPLEQGRRYDVGSS
jgi:ribonuclease BN (tRNA processing enzyme)